MNKQIHKVHKLILLVCCIAIFLPGCSSIPNPITRTEADFSALPVDTMTEVAYFIEDQVRAGNRTPELKDQPGLVISTPEIQQSLRSRAARAHLVKELLDSGHSVEQSDGKIAIIRSEAYKASGTPNDRDRHAMIVISENRDRVILYDSLRKTNNLSAAARSAIEEIFFTARKAALEPGHKYRENGGDIQVR